MRCQTKNEKPCLWTQMNFYPNPDGPANHTGSNTRVNAYNMVKTETEEHENNKN